MASSGGTYGEVTIGGTAALLLIGNSRQEEVTLKNTHATQVLYIGTNSSVAVASGFPILAGESITLRTGGTLYAIASGAGTTVRYLSLT